MAITYRIFPPENLVYARYEGFACVQETLRIFAEVAQHPDSRPSQNHLVDLSRISDFDRDMVGLMQVQAEQTDHFLQSKNQPILVFYAPTELGQRMASRAQRSWQELGGIVSLIIADIDQALTILGLAPNFLDQVELAYS